jgi:hypothetical protein
MSYSRWSNSYWYTYWRVAGEGVVENRNNAVLDICSVISFTAKQLRENLDQCMKEVQELSPDGDIYELRLYVNRFLNDVDKQYIENR